MKKLASISLIAILVVLICGCASIKSDYEKAVDLMEEEKYEEARKLFLQDEENANSPSKAKECAYKIITSYLDANLSGWDEYSGSYTQDNGDYAFYTVRVKSCGNGKIELEYLTDFKDSYNILGQKLNMNTDISTTVTLDHTTKMAECNYAAKISLNSDIDNYESRGKLDITKVSKNDIGNLENVSGRVGQPKQFESGISSSISKLDDFLSKRNLGITMKDLGFKNY